MRLKYKNKKYRYLEREHGVCGGRIKIKGTRIEPSHVVGYKGTVEEVKQGFGITDGHIAECYLNILEDRRKGRK